MLPAEKEAIIQKELELVDVYISNLEHTSGWRLPTLALLAGDVRKTIRKCTALFGYTGQWWRDIALYLTTLIPLAIPINLALGATIFTSLATTINQALSVVEMESRMIKKTIEVPFFWIFTRKINVSENTPVLVTHPPEAWVAPAITTAILVFAILITSYTMKYLWLFETKYRASQIRKLMEERRYE
jgi:hypothetical protein